VAYTIPSNCKVGFTGYCLGQKVHDSTGDSSDVRWFELPDGRVVASAIVHGNPPAALRPGRCNHDRPAPRSLRFTVDATSQPGSVTVHADGSEVDIVGFSVAYPSSPHSWHQVAFTDATAGAVTATWKVAGVPRRAEDVLLVGAACLGGDGPTPVVAAKTLRQKDLTVLPQPPILTAQELSEAAQLACQYPG
jgi:hypothetical protein